MIDRHLPGFAFEPPTIFGFPTLVNPHPSFGVSKRPLIAEFGAGFDFPNEYLH